MEYYVYSQIVCDAFYFNLIITDKNDELFTCTRWSEIRKEIPTALICINDDRELSRHLVCSEDYSNKVQTG